MNQTRPADGMSTTGFNYPQIGYFVDEICECLVGFSSTYPDASRVKSWIDSNVEEMARFYGTEIAEFVRKSVSETIDADHADYEARGHEGYSGDVLTNGLEKLIVETVPKAAAYELACYVP